MAKPRAFARAGLAGVIAGALVLGVGGRLLMRVVSLATTGRGNFSAGGTIEVVLAGALFGGMAGLFLAALPQRLGRWRAPLHAALVFTAIGLLSGAARGAASSVALTARLVALAGFAVLMLLFSLLTLHLAKEPATPATGS